MPPADGALICCRHQPLMIQQGTCQVVHDTTWKLHEAVHGFRHNNLMTGNTATNTVTLATGHINYFTAHTMWQM